MSDSLVSNQLEENRQWMADKLADCSDIVFRDLYTHDRVQALVIYVEGMADSEMLSEHLLSPLVYSEEKKISTSQAKASERLEQLLDAVLTGNAALFVDGQSSGIIVSVRGGTRRGVEEPSTEAVIRGPREGFTENLRTNTALVRFRLKTPNLKMQKLTIGKETRTQIVLAYIEGIVDPKVLTEVRNRLSRIDIDGILESGNIEELIEDEPFLSFSIAKDRIRFPRRCWKDVLLFS